MVLEECQRNCDIAKEALARHYAHNLNDKTVRILSTGKNRTSFCKARVSEQVFLKLCHVKNAPPLLASGGVPCA